jgi:hypothetical protein
MADTNTASGATPATEAPAEQTPAADPFQGFETEAYDAGERVADAAAEPAPGGTKATQPAEKTGEGGTEAQAGTEGAPEGAQPKPQSAQERINEITRARREAERRAEAAERRAQELEAQLSDPGRAPAAADPAAPAGKPTDTVSGDLKEPNPEDFDYGELDPRYIAAVVRHETLKVNAEIREAARKERETQTAAEQHRAARERFEAQATVGAEKYADYHEKVVEGAEKGEWPLSAELGMLLVESEVGDEIAYHLATNPEEAIRVFHLSPVQQAREFGRLEAKFSAAGPAATGATPKVDPPAKAPKAPFPVLPARGAGGQFQATAQSEDFAAFEASVNGK